MAAWASGIVVVAAAGNRGPDPLTINAPGDVPYVITVGAVTDNYYPLQPMKYSLASFSSAGPTFEGFVKPDVLGMGGHILAYAPDNGTLAAQFPQWVVEPYPDFSMSGTSQAAAVVSGVVALMLEVNPRLTPDQVKCRLMSGARPAVNSNGTLAYTVFQQGAGLVDAQNSAYSTASNCANQGLNVALDLAGLQHYGGRAIPLSLFATSVPTMTGLAAMPRPVVDQTGLSGLYDFTLTWVHDPSGDDAIADNIANFREALKAQLGLELKRSHAPMSFLIVDHVERPSEN